jgi:toxin ParE1/3/4
MAKKIVWLHAAVDDLEEIARFIESRGSAFAGIVVARILQIVEPLAGFPQMGPVIREDESGRHRHLICYSYRIIYRPEGDYVFVVGVIHGARELPAAVLATAQPPEEFR